MITADSPLVEFNEKQEIARLLANRPRWPRFPAHTEAVFLKSYAHHHRVRMRCTLALGLLLYVCAGLIAWRLDPAGHGSLWQIRFAVTAVFIATVLAMVFRVKRDTLMQILIAGAALAAGTGMAAFLAAPFPVYGYAVGAGAVLLYIYVVSGLRLGYALACGLTLTGLYAGGALVFMPAGSVPFGMLAALLVMTNLAGAYSGWRLEQAARRSFLYGRMVRLLSNEMVELAGVDELTGLANRRRLDDYLANTWARAQRDQVEISLLLMDVDYLQMLNDHLGRSAGDICLRKLGTVLQHYRQRPGDLAARYAGGKFLVVLYGCHRRHARNIAERLRHDVESLNLMNPASPIGWTVSVSIGVHSVVPDRRQSVAGALAAADTLLHLAKKSGHNRVMGDADAVQAQRPDASPDTSRRQDRTLVLRSHTAVN
jgi:diguanylate cyclase (GGDEF)-like protein